MTMTLLLFTCSILIPSTSASKCLSRIILSVAVDEEEEEGNQEQKEDLLECVYSHLLVFFYSHCIDQVIHRRRPETTEPYSG